MRYSRALFVAAALSAAACGQNIAEPTEPALGGFTVGSSSRVPPAAPRYGVGWGGGQFADTTTTESTSRSAPSSGAVTDPADGAGASGGEN